MYCISKWAKERGRTLYPNTRRRSGEEKEKNERKKLKNFEDVGQEGRGEECEKVY